MIPKIIHYCWFGGGEIPKEYHEYIVEWGELHPDWEIRRWDESNFCFDNNYLVTAKTNNNWSNLSNYLRLSVINEFGGVYLDTDFKVIKPLDELLQHECFLGFESGNTHSEDYSVNNALIGGVKGHYFIKKCLERIVSVFDGNEQSNLSGPILATSVLKEEYGLERYKEQTIAGVKLYEKEAFYPLPYDKAHDRDKIEQYVTPNTFAVHVWGRSWYSKYELLDRIDSQTKFIEERSDYIKKLENLINSQNSGRSESLPYILDSIFVEDLMHSNGFLTSLVKNQEYLLNNIINKISRMENIYKEEVAERNSSHIYEFLFNRIRDIESKLMDMTVDQKIHMKSIEAEFKTRDSLFSSIKDEIGELTKAQTQMIEKKQNESSESESYLNSITQILTTFQEEFRNELLSLINTSKEEAISNSLPQSIEPLIIEEAVATDKNVKECEDDKPVVNSAFTVLSSEINLLKDLNNSLTKEKDELIATVHNYQVEADHYQAEISKLTFKVNSLTTYIDNFGHVRNEYDQRIQMLEELIQKMRLKNRAKRLVGVYKPNN
ncbi:glycosyltransferase [Pontibacter cellulosilyticus]|uniref:Alpha 1,4-glycosyltransferase domain-containing protein n=1 Tax=Pontibacter cellulosilyticus TaxID=1720253 RepID=A0A923N4Y5_9BACT|nr:glycosyltransferase [Pontibacter cellulosilyticus]MBC5992316.1 hypothetical protein [Pontibacter cellulosilyticus]